MKKLPIALLCLIIGGCAAPQPYQQKYYSNASTPSTPGYSGLRATALDAAAAIAESNEVVSGMSDEKLIEIAKETTANGLKDPNSAQFRRLEVKNFRGNRIVCGEVNGKNAYGGYVGFKRFIGGVAGFQIEETGGKYPDINRAANAGITEACL